MGCYSLCFSGLGHHEQLWEDCDTLEIYREGPENLHNTEFMVEDQGEDGDWSKEEFNAECIVVAIIGCFELYKHQVDCSNCAGNEEDLHRRVVDTNKVSDKVEIPGDKHDCEENLALSGDTGTGASLPYLEEQDDDG